MFNHLKTLPAYADDLIINVVVEIPKGDRLKYEYSENGEYLTVVRELHPRYRYPFNYGFIPQTLAGDKDPLDAIVIHKESFAPGTILRCKVIGVITTIDQGEEDDKILCVPVFSKPTRINIKKVFNYLNHYKYPYQKGTYVKAVLGPLEAYKRIKCSVNNYIKGEI